MDLRWVLLVVSNYLLLFLVAEANHFLSGMHLHLIPAGLFVAYAAVRFSQRPGFISTLGAGVLLEAGREGPWGVQLFLLLVLHSLLLRFRRRLAPGELWQLAIAATACTLLNGIGLSLAGLIARPEIGPYLLKCSVDLLLATAVTALVAPWWFSLQSHGLGLLGFDRRDEEAETA